MSNQDATGSGHPAIADPPPVRRGQHKDRTLARRLDRKLWELDALIELLETDLPPASGAARLVRCRYQAARALLLELVAEHSPPAPAERWIGGPGDQLAETGLLGALCRRHGWRAVRPGVLVRSEGRADG